MLTAAIILFILFFLLIIPVDAEFKFNNLNGNEKTVKLRALFGLVSKTVYPSLKSTKKEKKKTSLDKKKQKSGKGLSNILTVLGNRAFVRKTINTLKKLILSIKPDLKSFHFRLGLNDPADTGMVWGLIGPLSGVLYGFTEKDVIIEPDFLDPALGIKTEGNLTIVPLELIVILVSYLLSPLVIKTYFFELRGSN